MKRLMIAALGIVGFASIALTTAPTLPTNGLARHAPSLSNHPNISVPATGVHGGSKYNYTASYNWSGFASAPNAGTFTSVRGSWQVPVATCIGSANESHAFWVGLDGFQSGTVEQGGTFTYCSGTTPYYYAWWEMYPTNAIQVVYAVRPGDFINASVVYASGKFKITVTDTTIKHSLSVSRKCASNVICYRSSAEWIGEAPYYGGYGTGNLAEWTNHLGQQQLGFYSGTAAMTGGTKTSIANLPALWWIGMVNSADTYYLAYPSGFGSKGNGFQDYWSAES